MGRLTLPDGALVYLDTAPVIYTIERHPEYWQSLIPLWTALQSQTIQIISSELLLLECLVNPIKTNNTTLIDAYEQFLSAQITLFPIHESILRSAAELRARTKLKTPDSIHIATALSQKATLFLTNDQGITNIDGLNITVLKDLS
jgi:predicted nucleic acid-binding protein